MKIEKIFCSNNHFIKIIVIVTVIMLLCSCSDSKSDMKKEEMKMRDEVNTETNSVFSKYNIDESIISKIDIIPDAKTAMSVSEEILNSIYGKDNIKNKLPFKVTFDSEYDAWVVSGTLKPNMVGGVPTIIIQKKDGKVLAVTHTK
jgi:hypothetical protein